MTRILIAAALVACCAKPLTADESPSFKNVACDGTYPHHLQGVCTDGKQSIYWSFTTTLIKTDTAGKVLKKIAVGNHHGDLCHRDGKIYVAVNFGRFNDPEKRADSWVYVYNADDLNLLAKHKIPELVYGAGGIAPYKEHFYVVGGLPENIDENYVYEYDESFQFVKRHVVNSGHTHLGIQTAEFADGHWWFGCYGSPQILLKVDENFETVERFEFNCPLGIVRVAENTFLVASGACSKESGCTGKLELAEPDEKNGLRVLPANAVSFKMAEDRLHIAVAGKPFAEYVFRDEKIRRPYFRHLHTPAGIRVTRQHPPAADSELADHPTMHPGLWMAFGDVSDADFWRNKGRVRHIGFRKLPAGGKSAAEFTLDNFYESADRSICSEKFEIRIERQSRGTLLTWTSRFQTGADGCYFGDQEEMGLGVRVDPSMTVVNGGTIRDSEGRKDEKGVWGKQADWCEYRGKVEGQQVGIALLASPKNFRRSWFHARNYGLLVANPFGRNAFTKGEKSRVEVAHDMPLTLTFGVFVYDVNPDDPPDIAAVYRAFCEEIAARPE